MHKKILEKLVFIFLIFIVLGQLPGFFIDRHLDLPFTIHPLDFLMVLMSVITIIKNRKPLPSWIIAGLSFLAVGAFSIVVYWGIHNAFSPSAILYLARYFAFVFACHFFYSFWGKKNKMFLLKAVGIVGIGIAILGWVQYLILPDIRTLKMFGWDDHLFRLVSSYLDPAFTGILLVISILIFIHMYLCEKNKYLVLAVLFLIITTLFTYSRSSYLALFVGVFSYGLFTKYKKLLVILFFLLAIPLLPRPSSEGVKLERLYSIVLKIENTKQGIDMFKTSPVIGIGLNNTCLVKQKIFGEVMTNKNNSCAGLDNSFMFVLLTTGVLGMVMFANYILVIYRTTLPEYKGLIAALGAAVFTHSMFTNTIFYIGILALLAIIIGVTRITRVSS